MDLFSTQNILFHIPIGVGGYDLSWIEAIGTLAGLLCIWLASLEKSVNYAFGLLNVTLFAIIFFQIQLYASLLLQLFFFGANIYGWYAWSPAATNRDSRLEIRWLPLPKLLGWAVFCVIAIGLLTRYIDATFSFLAHLTVRILRGFGISVASPVIAPDAWPFWDAAMTVLSVVAMVLMTRKYVENWILWVAVNLISTGIFARQGVYAMALEYLLLTFIALNGYRMWIARARRHRPAPDLR